MSLYTRKATTLEILLWFESEARARSKGARLGISARLCMYVCIPGNEYLYHHLQNHTN